MKIGKEESENNINSKEGVDNVVEDEESVMLVGKKCKLEGRNPSRVDDEGN